MGKINGSKMFKNKDSAIDECPFKKWVRGFDYTPDV